MQATSRRAAVQQNPTRCRPAAFEVFLNTFPPGNLSTTHACRGGKLHASAPRQTADALTRTGSTQSIDVNFWLAVVTSGEFRYFLNIEAQP